MEVKISLNEKPDGITRSADFKDGVLDIQIKGKYMLLEEIVKLVTSHIAKGE